MRSGSGSQPVPLSSRSASIAISFFLRSASSSAVVSPLASLTAATIRDLVTRLQIIIGARHPSGLRHVELQGFGELEGMPAFLRNAHMRFVHRVDGETGAMREQRFAIVGIEALQRLPELLGFFRQRFFPRAMPRRDRRRGRKIGKARKRRRERVLGLDLQAGVGRVVVEQPQASARAAWQERRCRDCSQAPRAAQANDRP